MFEMNHKYDKAIQEYLALSVMEDYFDKSELFFRIGLAYYKLGRFVLAQSYFSKASMLDHDNYEYMGWVGFSFWKMKQWDQALFFLSQGVNWPAGTNLYFKHEKFCFRVAMHMLRGIILLEKYQNVKESNEEFSLCHVWCSAPSLDRSFSNRKVSFQKNTKVSPLVFNEARIDELLSIQ
jgi:tetratricopeptide (TPR) repeat protein